MLWGDCRVLWGMGIFSSDEIAILRNVLFVAQFEDSSYLFIKSFKITVHV